MSYQLWSWLLTIVGVTGFILAGKKVWWCWYINIGCQGLWVTYAIVTEQYGFIVASAVYTVVFSRNAVVWTREHRDPYRNFDLNEIAWPEHVEQGRHLASRRDDLISEGVDPSELEIPMSYYVDKGVVVKGRINEHTILRLNRHSSLPPFQWYGPMTEPHPPGPHCICTGCTTRAMM